MNKLPPRPPPAGRAQHGGASALEGGASAGGGRRLPSAARARTAAPAVMGEELLMELQFTGVSEELRRMCFLYGNRFVQVEIGSDDEDDEDAGGGELEGGVRRFMYQLPSTDARPYDGARVSPSVLVAFAEDMMISPHLLHPDEVKLAVVETLERRKKRAHLPASMDKTLCDFMVVCAIKVMAKKPFCNVHGSATTRHKVRALVDFVCLDYHQVVCDVLESRFSVRL